VTLSLAINTEYETHEGVPVRLLSTSSKWLSLHDKVTPMPLVWEFVKSNVRNFHTWRTALDGTHYDRYKGKLIPSYSVQVVDPYRNCDVVLTRGGDRVLILTRKAPGLFPILGIYIDDENTSGRPDIWRFTGEGIRALRLDRDSSNIVENRALVDTTSLNNLVLT
jgi:hypothetical protein